MHVKRAKALLKARRVTKDSLPAWAIGWYHYCRSPRRSWCSRYGVELVFDAWLIESSGKRVPWLLSCPMCKAYRYIEVSMLPQMYDEARITVQLQAVTRCE